MLSLRSFTGGRNIAFAVLLSLLAGCSRPSPTAPRQTSTLAANKSTMAEAAGFGSGTFFPLAVGNAWEYSGDLTIRYSRDGVQTQAFDYPYTVSRRIIGTTHLDGKSYFVEENTQQDLPATAYNKAEWWLCKRQDATGLFSFAVLAGPPPLDGMVASSPTTMNSSRRSLPIDLTALHQSGNSAGALQRLGERLRVLQAMAHSVARDQSIQSTEAEGPELLYPLRVGATWTLAVVDKVENLTTPAGTFPAYRIEINPGANTLHEGEWYRVWYSRKGLLKSAFHLSQPVLDWFGNPTGETYTADESVPVTSIVISSKRPSS